MYVNGRWVDAPDGGRRAIVNPATEEVFAEVSYGGRECARGALEAARDAMPAWRSLTAYGRAAYLWKIAEGMRGRCDEIARVMTLEAGKPLAESRSETLAAADQFEWYAEEIKRAYGRIAPARKEGKRIFVIRHPVGVCATISPFNFPALLQARKIAPALAAGCAVVARPASQTPLTLIRIFEVIDEIGLPLGVANLVMGEARDLSEEFLTNPICRKISFTGSTAVGKELQRRGADRLVRLSLELGGHAPVIVFPDADVEAAAKASVIGKFRNNGQVCISPSRFYAHKDIVKQYTEASVEFARALKQGNGLDEGVEIGPMIDRAALERAEWLVGDALSGGARVLTGGRRPPRFDKGFFFEPTVLSRVHPSMAIMKEEPFAPIMPILEFETLDEVIAKANDTRYGLASYVMTQDITAAIKMAESLEFGIIGLNDTVPATAEAPFGGMKESGYGREGGVEGLDGYLEIKYVSLALR
jgi:succinate-semialdehyde dehydrogenase/glutarate-semialdehyde dehydrogenase